MGYERTGGREIFQGQVVSVHRDRFRHDDGVEVERDVVRHPGAVAIVAHDGEDIWLVAQPREATGVQQLLEIPAGKLDIEGKTPLEVAKIELAEEIGKAATDWQHLVTFWATPGFADEQVHIYLATGL